MSRERIPELYPGAGVGTASRGAKEAKRRRARREAAAVGEEDREPAAWGQPEEVAGRPGWLPAASGKRHLVIHEFGVSLGKAGERLVVRKQGKPIAEIPLRDLEQVTVASRGCSFSSDVVEACVEHGVFLNFLDSRGSPYARLMSPTLLGTVAQRREQFLALGDGRGVAAACAFLEGKIRNQASVLRYFGRHRRRANRALYERLEGAARDILGHLDELAGLFAAPEPGAASKWPEKTGPDTAGRGPGGGAGAPDGTSWRIDDVRGQLLSIEGRAGDRYWAAVEELLSNAGVAGFPGRERRGATDPVNSMLNYGYGILYHEVWGAVVLAGLEPFAGFLHTDRPGKPSLVLDLVEEFRQPLVDRPVLALLTRGYEARMEGDRLEEETRRRVSRAVRERLADETEWQGRRVTLRAVVHLQARRLVRFLLGEAAYRPFVARW